MDGPPVLGGAVQETAAVATDGKVYVIGGFSGTLGVVDTVRVYDTATCTWSDGPTLPEAIHHANAAVVDGTIYVVGAMRGLNFQAIGSVWSLAPEAGAEWTAETSMPAGTERGSAITGAIGTKIYVAGGLRGGAVTDVSAYDTATGTWEPLPALPEPRDHGCGGVVGGKLYVTGGRQATIASTAANVYEYTPGGDWVERTPMPTARGGTGCGVIDDRIIVVGGEGNPETASMVFEEVEAYSPSGDSWETLDPMPVPRHGMGAAAWEGRLYVPGGATQDGFGAVDTHEVLTP